MGIRIPVDELAINMFIIRETPADAPAVRNMSDGLEGYPSRAKIAVLRINYRGHGRVKKLWHLG